MEQNKKYVGVGIFVVAVLAVLALVICAGYYMWNTLSDMRSIVKKVQNELSDKEQRCNSIKAKITQLRTSRMTAQKKIYAPSEDNLGNDTLFFTLYNDLIEMIHSNSIKIKSIDYKYNPEGDPFVSQKGMYFVCDVNMELVSNYINLGKLIQDIYQYPYYIKINSVEVLPYQKDKKILITTMSVRLFAHTSSEESFMVDEEYMEEDEATTEEDDSSEEDEE